MIRRLMLLSLQATRPMGNAAVIALSLGLITMLDYVTGSELSFSIFYLVPVGIATLRYGRRGGVALAVISATAWYLVDRISGTTYSNALLPIWNSLVRLGFFVTIAVLLNELRLMVREEAAAARVDPVSGLLNRTGFTQAASREVARASRLGSSITFLYIDVDDFKTINDQFGHSTGDAVLAAIGRACSSTLRSVDLAARIGGDEFVVCLPDTGAGDGEKVARRLRSELDPSTAALGLSVGLSIGVVAFARAPESLDVALAEVDAAMYRAKQTAGKDTTTVTSLSEDAA